MLARFREEVYHSFEKRADAGLDLIDALTSAAQVGSPVELSESLLFRRKFSSIFDCLTEGRLNEAHLRRVLAQLHPPQAETIAGLEGYAVDCTDDPAAAAATLADRTLSKRGAQGALTIGHRYSWLVRLMEEGSSWVLPQDVARVASHSSDGQVAAAQVEALAAQRSQPKVITADTLYATVLFLKSFVGAELTYALVRLRRNQLLYEAPPPRAPGQRGRPNLHGARFALAAPPRLPDQEVKTTLRGQAVRLRAWHGLHLRRLAALDGTLVQVEFLKADGTPRFARPLYLFWSGPLAVPLEALARMYLGRFAIEHAFRFLKQHLALNQVRSTNLAARQRWLWCCALAYCQLLFLRDQVASVRPAWYPRRATQPVALTPRQVQRQALPFLLTFGTPARPTQPAGKGPGRAPGFRPAPRPRHKPLKKGPKRRKAA